MREAPNIRQSFDGARINHTVGDLKLDAFYLQPVTITPGAFDNSHNRAQRFYGLYASAKLPRQTLDVYAPGLERDAVRFGMITSDERRSSLGVTPRKDISLEASYTVHHRGTGADAIYLQPLVPLAPAGADRSKDVGAAVQLDGSWQATRNLKLQAQLVQQAAGSAMRVRCPSRAPMINRLSPALAPKLANECRRSWIRTSSRPAALRRRSQGF